MNSQKSLFSYKINSDSLEVEINVIFCPFIEFLLQREVLGVGLIRINIICDENEKKYFYNYNKKIFL